MSNIWTNPDVGSQYLENLLEEKKSLAFYVHRLPICNNLLNQEIERVSEIISNQDFNIFGGLQFGSPNLSSPLNTMPNVAALNLGHLNKNSGWNPFQHQANIYMGFGGSPGLPIDHRNAVAASPCTLLTKKFLHLDLSAIRYHPNFNVVGRLLGPRGHSLKRIEDFTGCRLFIRGRGSMKDRNKEERFRGRQGYEHLNEPLHVLIEAESPANEVHARLRYALKVILLLLKPVSKSQDVYGMFQFLELAMLNSLVKENTSQPSCSSASPCRSGAMKRATNGRKGTK